MLERIHCTSTANEFLSWFFSIARKNKNLSYSHSSVIDSCHSSLSGGFIQQNKASGRRQWGPKPIVTLVGLYGFIKYLFASLSLHLQLRGSYFLINQLLVITCSYLFPLTTPCKGCKRKWEEWPIKFIILKTLQLHLIIKMVTDLQSCLWTHLALLDKGQQVKNHNSNKHKWWGFERPSRYFIDDQESKHQIQRIFLKTFRWNFGLVLADCCVRDGAVKNSSSR